MSLFKYITNKVYKMHQILQQLGYLQESLDIISRASVPNCFSIHTFIQTEKSFVLSEYYEY